MQTRRTWLATTALQRTWLDLALNAILLARYSSPQRIWEGGSVSRRCDDGRGTQILLWIQIPSGRLCWSCRTGLLGRAALREEVRVASSYQRLLSWLGLTATGSAA